ncbi:alpha/beta fold hydrolase [Paraliomyxa miuraensis]|uniref:alpha/beta fold hydrolase n=1 Tax=Paraliomyxa miuraensis TaxID=376150 RepID=UPI002257C5CA|nr:alpha/beta hydrolase [Paraliomyxa miuraensis]MCX4243297.1 alpha/beta hydrolase [Paraliomyxa miuraensis]
MLTVPERMMRRVLNAQGLDSRWLPTSVGRMHVIDGVGRGELPPIVLLHGFSANAISYLGLLQRLLPHAGRLIVPDCPGHGFSELPTAGLSPDTMMTGMFEALDRILDEPAIVLGTSMGGFGAVRYAAARPHKVRGLVLVCPGGAPMDPAALRRFTATFRVPRHADALRFVDRMLASSPPGLRHVLAHAIRGRFANPDLQGLLDGLTPDDLLRPEELSGLSMPTLMLWGRQEMILPPDHLDFFQRHLPHSARVEIWDRFGHCGYLEQPGPVARRVLKFTRTTLWAQSPRDHRRADGSAQDVTHSAHRTAHLH